MKKSYWLYKMCLLLGLGICIPVTGNASDIGDATLTQQQSKITASGVVVDESGESLIGASVIEKGAATNGTITDIDGRFSLSVAPNRFGTDRDLSGTVHLFQVVRSFRTFKTGILR